MTLFIHSPHFQRFSHEFTTVDLPLDISSSKFSLEEKVGRSKINFNYEYYIQVKWYKGNKDSLKGSA